VLVLALKLTLAPGLVAATTVAGRRWGPRVAGWLGGLPVVVGPILFALALEQGDAFAAEAAQGSLLGLLSLNAFVLAYAWAARRVGWAQALLAGWGAFAAATVVLDPLRVSDEVALAVVVGAFFLTEAALPRGRGEEVAPHTPRFDLLLRTVCTAALVLGLTALAGVLGPRLSGMLAAFPVLASVLAAFTQAQAGAVAAADFLRGLVRGLISFALFCFVVAVLLPSAGMAVAFGAATFAALGAHAVGHGVSSAFGWPARQRSRSARLAASNSGGR
jgi:hypothetical protein